MKAEGMAKSKLKEDCKGIDLYRAAKIQQKPSNY